MAKTQHSPVPKPKLGKRDLYSYTIRGTNKIVKAGDCVLMRPSDTGKPPYVARVEKIESDIGNNVKVSVWWYYRPEESIGGRHQFHGDIRSFSFLTTTTFRAHTPLKESVSFTPSRTTPSLRM
ncbi:hypothetical protein SAY87_009292 [Trapa incisa]|uniref:BAH domain-containing protein n=1 Tax=Trapa incisa TaxID=236973 RepID=A0AAN7JUS2_9MYRT|nr:hypothetical protein SAY87_009292 [Trapa incisa]